MEILTKIIGIIVVIALASMLMALPTMLLWNWIIANIFELKQINFAEAIGINIIIGVLKSKTAKSN